jgi:hypothetical protein
VRTQGGRINTSYKVAWILRGEQESGLKQATYKEGRRSHRNTKKTQEGRRKYRQIETRGKTEETKRKKAIEEILLGESLPNQLLEKLPVFCGTRSFVTVLTTAYHLALPFNAPPPPTPSCFFKNLK